MNTTLILITAVILLLLFAVLVYLYLKFRYGVVFSFAEFLSDPFKNFERWFN